MGQAFLVGDPITSDPSNLPKALLYTLSGVIAMALAPSNKVISIQNRPRANHLDSRETSGKRPGSAVAFLLFAGALALRSSSRASIWAITPRTFASLQAANRPP